MSGLRLVLALCLALGVFAWYADTELAPSAPPPARVAPAAALPDLSDKRVLVLSPYGFGRPGLDVYIQQYMTTLIAHGMSAENVMVEYLNLNRDHGREARELARKRMLLDYAALPVDLIVTLQQPGLNYMLSDLATLAPGAPILAINGTLAPGVGEGRIVLQQAISSDFDGTIRRALELFPNTRTVLMATGASSADVAVQHVFESAALRWKDKLKFEYTDKLTLAQIEQRVTTLAPDTVIVAGSINRDAAGATLTPLQVAAHLGRMANRPMFCMNSIGIGDGCIGGSVNHVERGAQAAADLSLDVITNGAHALRGSGLIASVVPPVPMFDWILLKRWGGKVANLPPHTIFLNRPASLWQEHRIAVLATLAMFAVLLAMLATLLLQRRRLRSAEAGTRDSEARFRVLVEHAPEAIVVYDIDLARFVDANTNAERLFGCSREELLKAGPQRFYDPDQPDAQSVDDSMATNIARTMSGEQVVLERAVRSLDGRCILCEVRLVALPAAGRRLLRSGYIDITERKKAELELLSHRNHLGELVRERTRALSVAMQQAQTANNAKSVFLASMSHELRTPLNAVIGFSRMMEGAFAPEAPERRNLAIINRAGHHLLTLINDILELSKIEAGRVLLEPELLDLRQLLEEVLEMARARGVPAGVQLALAVEHAPPPVMVDGVKLRQVLLNLLTNALKFVTHGSVTLVLDWRARDSASVALTLSVRDTGIGIAKADHERIFEPFTQAGTQRQSGTGLGLTISRQFVRLMGGELMVESELGKGAVFAFTIDVEQRPGMLAPAAPQVVASLRGAAGKTILIVDDDPDCRELLQGLLAALDCVVVAVSDGIAARDCLPALAPDLVLMDWRMPGMDGLALTRWLRAQTGMRQPRVILLTASAFARESQAAFDAGADEFMRKPIEQDKLYLALARQLECAVPVASPAPAAAAELAPLTPDELAPLPPAHRADLMRAVRELDQLEAALILDRIAAEMPQLAARIGVMLDQEAYLQLWQMLHDGAMEC
ncbi:MAG: ATP-binding protein [Pseudomonadota bacterium]